MKPMSKYKDDCLIKINVPNVIRKERKKVIMIMD